MDIETFAAGLGITACKEIDPALLVPSEQIRGYCIANKCGSYGKNYACPPYCGTLEELAGKISAYSHALLLQYAEDMDVSVENVKEVARTKNEFHAKILEIEDYLHEQGIADTWGLIGGNCGLCRPCMAETGEPCRYPDKRRSSLEAIGIDVTGLLEQAGMDSGFHPDRITWTGCILYNE